MAKKVVEESKESKSNPKKVIKAEIDELFKKKKNAKSKSKIEEPKKQSTSSKAVSEPVAQK